MSEKPSSIGCGMGYGWLIDQSDTTLELKIESLFDILEIYPETPELPKTEIEDEE